MKGAHERITHPRRTTANLIQEALHPIRDESETGAGGDLPEIAMRYHPNGGYAENVGFPFRADPKSVARATGGRILFDCDCGLMTLQMRDSIDAANGATPALIIAGIAAMLSLTAPGEAVDGPTAEAIRHLTAAAAILNAQPGAETPPVSDDDE